MYSYDNRVRLLAVNSMLGSRPIELSEIMKRLEDEYNIVAERKSLYRDITAITLFRNIQLLRKGRKFYYYEPPAA